MYPFKNFENILYPFHLSEIGDVDSMAKYTLKILKDENLLAEMKRNAKEIALSFDIKKIIPLYEKMYDETIAAFEK